MFAERAEPVAEPRNQARSARPSSRKPRNNSRRVRNWARKPRNYSRRVRNCSRLTRNVGRTGRHWSRPKRNAGLLELDRLRRAQENPRQKGYDQMKRYIHNVMDMASNVAVYMAKNATLWQGVKAIGDTMDEINADLTTLNGMDAKQIAPTTGSAVDKASARFDFETKILLVANQLAALAAKNKTARWRRKPI